MEPRAAGRLGAEHGARWGVKRQGERGGEWRYLLPPRRRETEMGANLGGKERECGP